MRLTFNYYGRIVDVDFNTGDDGINIVSLTEGGKDIYKELLPDKYAEIAFLEAMCDVLNNLTKR